MLGIILLLTGKRRLLGLDAQLGGDRRVQHHGALHDLTMQPEEWQVNTCFLWLNNIYIHI